jgi:hypothetical protein
MADQLVFDILTRAWMVHAKTDFMFFFLCLRVLVAELLPMMEYRKFNLPS